MEVAYTIPSPNHICSHCNPEAETKKAHCGAFRVLYVGCDAESLVALRQSLGREQFQVVGCSERGGAILFLKSQIPYHLFLFDVEWLGVEGLKLARLARSVRHRKQTPAILVAATKSAGEMQGFARKVGVPKCVECVVKTRDMAGVTEVIKRLLESRERKPN